MDIDDLFKVYGIPTKPKSSKGVTPATSKSFVNAVRGFESENEEEAAPLVAVPHPQLEGENLTVRIDKGEYEEGLEANRHNAIGRLCGDFSSMNTQELRKSWKQLGI